MLLERAPGGRLGLGDGALFRLVLRFREAVRRAAVKLDLERRLGGFELIDHMAELDRKVRVLGAVQDEKHALGILRPAGGVTAERAMDRDIGRERRAGRPELDADRAAEAIADQRDARGVDQRLLGESSKPAWVRAFMSARSLRNISVCAMISSRFFGSMPNMSVAKT